MYNIQYAYLNQTLSLETTLQVLGYDEVLVDEATSLIMVKMHPGSVTRRRLVFLSSPL